MRPSYVRNVFIPDVTAGAQPAPIVSAGSRAVRVTLSRAIGPFAVIPISLADSAESLTPAPTGASFSWDQFNSTADLVFVLAPEQTLYGAAYGATVSVSAAVSDFFPTDTPLGQIKIAKTIFRTITLQAVQASPLVNAGQYAQRVVIFVNGGLTVPLGTTVDNVIPGASINVAVLHVGAGQQLFAGGDPAVAGVLVAVASSEAVLPL